MNPTGRALITGASSGIGKELAITHAEAGGELVIVARREAALKQLAEELKNEFGATVHVITADLSTVAGATGLVEEIGRRGLEIDILVNNAGFGGLGAYHERDLIKSLTMIDLNIKALMVLTHAFAQQMVARGRGRILNVGSTAGMVPGPGQATYHATKAFVNSFSFALAEELRERGVTVTVLAPGPVQTEFLEVADLTQAKGVQRAADPAEVARLGYRAMNSGRLLVIDNLALRCLLEWVVPFLPRRIVLRLAKRFGEQV